MEIVNMVFIEFMDSLNFKFNNFYENIHSDVNNFLTDNERLEKNCKWNCTTKD